MAIAFFDLDQTVLSANSGRLWVRREVALGQLSHRLALTAALWLFQYRLGLSGTELVEKAIAVGKGESYAALSSRTKSFYERNVRTLFRPGALKAIETHRRAGDRVVLLTSSTHLLAELVQDELSLDGVLCNRLEVEGGLLTGRTVGPLCYGPGKLVHARAEAEAHGTLLSACAFYTDSFSDLPVLEAVGRPVAVHPDVRLKRHARRRGWEILDWGSSA